MENLRTSTLATRKKTFLVLFFIIYFILNAYSYSQPSIQWQRTYDSPFHRDEGFNSICDAGNGNFYIAGYSETTNSSGFYMLKINPQGDTIWAKVIGGRNLGQGIQKVLSLNDGGCIFTGSNDTAFTMRLSSNGDIVWYKTYPVSGSFQYVDMYDIIKTSDGGFAMCGKIFGLAGCIYKLDTLGNLTWNKIHLAGFLKEYRNIIEMNPGYWVNGFEDNSGNSGKSIIININNLGDSLWQKEYTLFGRILGPSDIINISQRFLFFATAYDNVQLKFVNCFLKLDNNGNVIDSAVINSPFSKSDRLKNSYQINTNRYIIASYRTGTSGSDTTFAIAKIIDSSGNIINFKGFEGFEWSEFHSCIKANNGDLLFVGNASRFNQNDFDGYAVRTDSNLNVKPFGIEPISSIIPERFKLYQNFPNPFNPVTNIKFDLNTKAIVTLKIYNILGEEVTTLINEELNAGSYIINWNAEKQTSGIYFAKINFINGFKVIKILLLK